LNPSVFVAVIGCYAQLKPQEIASIEGVSVVLGANEKFKLLEYVNARNEEMEKVNVGHIKEVNAFVPSFSAGDRTRTFLKVQDGCNYFCAFCTIPLARGRSRSASIADTVLQAQQAELTGAKEIILTGVNIGDFGTSNQENLLGLISALEKNTKVERYRISSIEPNLLSQDMIEFVAQSKKFMPHFHIPLQSGDDEVLRMMRRRYRTDLYRDRVHSILHHIPDACIGVDVITGFPGETHEMFLNTMELLKSLSVAYLHVFTYSERPNTTAVRSLEIVPIGVRQDRTLQLRSLSEKLKRAFYKRYEGMERDVLWEGAEEEGRMLGYTDNYIRVSRPFDPKKVNLIERVKLNSGEVKFEF
jgi:threonylcarbamoyladenosine tRNA methylthiotransferase MtaB